LVDSSLVFGVQLFFLLFLFFIFDGGNGQVMYRYFLRVIEGEYSETFCGK